MTDKIIICCSKVSITGYDIVILANGEIERYTKIEYTGLKDISSVNVINLGKKTKAQEHALRVLAEYFKDYYRVKITGP